MALLPKLNETVNDAILNGYDFEELFSKIKNNKQEIEEYIYGYALSEDKISYLESMADDKVVKCDRIGLFSDKLDQYVKEVEKMPHTRILKGFCRGQDEDYEDGPEVSIYRIIIINDHAKTVIVRDLKHMEGGVFIGLSVWNAILNYNDAVNMIDESGTDGLIQKAGQMVDKFKIFSHILI